MATQIYELRVTLRYVHPPVWRRVAFPGNLSMARLHEVIQIVMYWGNEHMHEFVIPSGAPKLTTAQQVKIMKVHGYEAYMRARFTDRHIGDNQEDEYGVTLDELKLSVGRKFRYAYDFGDDWEHEIEVKKIHAPEAGIEYPVCLAGKMAAPPEDCGGPGGYAHILEALANAKHPEHEEYKDWLGDWDAQAIDLEDINRELKKFRAWMKKHKKK